MINKAYVEKGLYEIFESANLIEIDENNKYILTREIDSVEIISAIVEIEEKFDIEFPDELLIIDLLDDFYQLAAIVEDLINQKD